VVREAVEDWLRRSAHSGHRQVDAVGHRFEYADTHMRGCAALNGAGGS
jgi:hypothetical protein